MWTKRLVAERAGLSPGEIALDRTCEDCGRPHGRPRYPGVHISVTHSGALAGVAVADVPIGIDVEQRDRPLTEVASHLVAPGERYDDLHILWTRKEALLKATGDGLRVPMTDLLVSGPGEPPALLGWKDRPDLPSRILLDDLEPAPAYAGAVALIRPA
ncbi:4'-phosphopantetheinyl transferase family protein [Actinocorallia longicatena]|uniref:4'-phosphopantetheinyl transferase family protein n=1 Tax=Actinocorallia longicatena TaxID=111803 RepID=UPI0031D30C95